MKKINKENIINSIFFISICLMLAGVITTISNFENNIKFSLFLFSLGFILNVIAVSLKKTK